MFSCCTCFTLLNDCQQYVLLSYCVYGRRSTVYVGSSCWIGEVKKKMELCYFWISVTLGFCNRRGDITDPEKEALTNCIKTYFTECFSFSAIIRTTCFILKIHLLSAVRCKYFYSHKLVKFFFHCFYSGSRYFCRTWKKQVTIIDG